MNTSIKYKSGKFDEATSEYFSDAPPRSIRNDTCVVLRDL